MDPIVHTIMVSPSLPFVCSEGAATVALVLESNPKESTVSAATKNWKLVSSLSQEDECAVVY